MQAQAEEISIETIQTKLKLLRENADVYKAMHGEELYSKMMVDLLNKMTGNNSNGIGKHPFLRCIRLALNVTKIQGTTTMGRPRKMIR